MDIRLLGPVQLWSQETPIDVGPLQRRAVLAALAVDAGRPVTLSTLVDRVWDTAPPAAPRAALYAHVSRLRRLFDAGHGSGPHPEHHDHPGGAGQPGSEPTGAGPSATDRPGIRLLRQHAGYLLDVDPLRVDLHRFRHLATAARRAGPDDDRQADLLAAALGMWTGPALDEIPGQWAARTRSAWQEERLDAAVRWAEVELRRGLAARVIGPIRELLDQHPLVEPLVEILMRALLATDRQAEALDCYASMRIRLADELGVAPGPRVTAAYHAVLRGAAKPPEVVRGPSAPAPAGTSGPAGAPATLAAVPAELPADVPVFIGRERELAHLDRMVAAGADSGGPSAGSALVVISGTAGVGKTALALRWAHRVRPAFPDGQLYINLRGYDPLRPLTAGEALTRFLNALGVNGAAVPVEDEERATRFRTALAGRRLLILLDNAATAEQVRPLLPGAGSSIVVVTSRDSMSGLVAIHGAQRLALDRLPGSDALALLRRLLPGRVETEPDAARALAERCERLPLALRIAADLVATRAHCSLADLVADVTDLRRRLDLLDAGGDPRAAVRTVFSWSYRHLPDAAARAFRLIGLQPGPDIDAGAAAALLDVDAVEADRLLDGLHRAHLTEMTGNGRHSSHDLLRAYARELAVSHDADRRAALTRLFDYYLAAAATAVASLFPADTQPQPAPDPRVPGFDEPAAALSWLDRHRTNLANVCTYALAHGWPQHTIRLAHTLYRYHANGGHYTHLRTAQDQALTAARQLGDRAAEAHALSSLASVDAWLSRYQHAVQYLNLALDIFRDLGDGYGQARALGNLGVTHYQLGQYEPAADCYRRAQALFREVGDRIGEARAMGNLGDLLLRQGRYAPAVDLGRQSLDLHRALRDRPGEVAALGNLGTAYARQGRYRRAMDHQHEALRLAREIANRNSEAEALTALGDLHTALGRHDTGAEHHRQAAAIFAEIGSRDGQARALTGLGEAMQAAGHPRTALSHHIAALELADGDDRDPQARAHTGLGNAHHALGDDDHARHHWRQALTLYTDLGLPEARQVAEQLAALPQPVALSPNRRR